MAGLSFTVKNVVYPGGNIEDAAPKSLGPYLCSESLTPVLERKELMAGKEQIKRWVGQHKSDIKAGVPDWTDTWDQAVGHLVGAGYALTLGDGRDLEDGEDFPTDSI